MAIRAVRYALIIKRSLNQRAPGGAPPASSAGAIFSEIFTFPRSARPLYAPLFTLFCVNKIANLFDANHYM